MAQWYLITTDTVAAVEKSPRNVIMVPSGSVIDVPIALNGIQGLIEVTFHGETVLMFAEDIRDRGKPVFGASV
ncbi:hypothetical protein SBA4_80004 [Candidatus Sulfopaludibacter sp. SbA4]|nr:hypothetical protein SBA4_80004 [Candidatus Sulfopaludibacter sp. SbA4]